jgi:hypothetical protein
MMKKTNTTDVSVLNPIIIAGSSIDVAITAPLPGSEDSKSVLPHN